MEEKKSGTLVEPYDSYNYHSEPDGYMEIYESKCLKRIHVYSPEISTPVKTIELDYDFLNQHLGNQFLKSMLKSIVWRNNISGIVENSYNFNYYDDSTMSEDSTGYNPNYHYGAIESIKDHHGVLTQYTYTQIKQNECDTIFGDNDEKVIRKNSQMIMTKLNVKSCPGIYGNGEAIYLHGGTYDNGKEFIVVLGGDNWEKIWLYTFDGHNWVLDSIFKCKHFNSTEPKNVVTFKDGILYTKVKPADDDALLLFWQNGRWHMNNIAVKHMGIQVNDIKIGNDFLVVQGGRRGRELIWVYRRNENEWIHDKELFDYNVFGGNDDYLNVSAGENFFVVTNDDHKNACVYKWNGKKWFRKELPNNFPEQYRRVYACNNYFVITGGSKNDYLWLYYWSGDSLKETNYKCSLIGEKTKPVWAFLSSDYFVMKEEGNVKRHLWIISWDGKQWIEQRTDDLGDQQYADIYPGPNYIAVRGGDPVIFDCFRLYRKNDQFISSDDSIWVKDIHWERLLDENDTEIKDQFHIEAGSNSFLICTNSEYIPQKAYRWIYRFDGSNWDKIFFSSCSLTNTKSYRSVCSTPGGYGFMTAGNSEMNMEFIYKFQDNFHDIKSYVVSRKDVISLSTAETLTTTFEYDSSYFDAYIGSLKFHKVSVITENNGKTTNYYYNDGNFYTTRPDYKELDGLVYKTETRNEKNQLISSQMSFHKLFKENHWPSDIHVKRSDTTITCRGGVYDTSRILEYKYGTPSKTAKLKNTHNNQVQSIIFAHEIDTAMKNRYMLNQQCQTSLYEIEKGRGFMVGPSEVRSSQVNLWRKQPIYDFFAPCSSFVWNAFCDTSGNPFRMSPFKYDSSASYNIIRNWKYNGAVKKYNRHGIPLEKEDNSEKLSAIITGTSRKLPIGSADNCSHLELAVFTCDYKIGNSADWWDSLQGWKKNSKSLLVNDSTHFGQKAIKFTQRYGVRRDNLIIPGKAYIMSAWVKVDSGLVLMKTDFRHSTTNDRDAWPLRTLKKADSLGMITDSLRSVECAGKWKLMKIEIPVSITSRMDTSCDWYARAWIGEPESLTGSVCAYVDDVRFQPKDAHVTTTYYDTLYYQPTLTVDENNNPGIMIKYDLQGRPEKWYKINKHKPSQRTRIMKKEYHLYGESVSP